MRAGQGVRGESGSSEQAGLGHAHGQSVREVTPCLRMADLGWTATVWGERDSATGI